MPEVFDETIAVGFISASMRANSCCLGSGCSMIASTDPVAVGEEAEVILGVAGAHALRGGGLHERGGLAT